MADLSAPRAGLRPPGVRVINRSNNVAKVGLVVPAGVEIETDAYVAGQLLAQCSAFVVVDGVPGGDAVGGPAGGVAAASPPAGLSVEEAGGGAARRTSGRRKAGE